jgi:hypothetical protein
LFLASMLLMLFQQVYFFLASLYFELSYQ